MDEDESKAAPQHGCFGRMTRENKLALVVGFGLILIVGILISDHLSAASRQEAAQLGVVDPLAANTTQAAARLVEYQPSQQPSETRMRSNTQQADSADLHIVDQSRNVGGDDSPRTDVGGHAIDLSDPESNASARNTAVEPARPQTETQLEIISLDDLSEATPPTGITFHDVRDREALSTICSSFYGTASLVNALADFNAIADPNLVQAGTRLKLPATLKGVTRRTPGEHRPSHTARQKQSELRTYTIKRGDTLSELAQKLLGSASRWSDLQKANPREIPDPDRLIEGITIRIPAD